MPYSLATHASPRTYIPRCQQGQWRGSATGTSCRYILVLEWNSMGTKCLERREKKLTDRVSIGARNTCYGG
jgi:hypothetical protein